MNEQWDGMYTRVYGRINSKYSPLPKRNDKNFIFATLLMLWIGLMFVWGAIHVKEANAQAPRLYDPRTGKYLGNLSRNVTDPDSVYNPIGRYGSVTSPDSINNPVGEYGSPISNRSARNPIATEAPIIVSPRYRGLME